MGIFGRIIKNIKARNQAVREFNLSERKRAPAIARASAESVRRYRAKAKRKKVKVGYW